MLVTVAVTVAAPATAQWGWRTRRAPPRFYEREARSTSGFMFCRLMYRSVRGEPLGHGWDTDYPGSDENFMTRFSEFTTATVSRDLEGGPLYVVVRPTDDNLFRCPFLFMSDAGTAGFDASETQYLRGYLLRGGLLYADDFWGSRAWEHWEREIGKILPPERYPIVDIPLDHPIFTIQYDVARVPQIPSIQFWRRSGGRSTSERGFDSEEPHLRGIMDDHGRLLVVMTHNTDIADGWEREGEEFDFFHRFSADAYALAINIVLYTMTH